MNINAEHASFWARHMCATAGTASGAETGRIVRRTYVHIQRQMCQKKKFYFVP